MNCDPTVSAQSIMSRFCVFERQGIFQRLRKLHRNAKACFALPHEHEDLLVDLNGAFTPRKILGGCRKGHRIIPQDRFETIEFSLSRFHNGIESYSQTTFLHTPAGSTVPACAEASWFSSLPRKATCLTRVHSTRGRQTKPVSR